MKKEWKFVTHMIMCAVMFLLILPVILLAEEAGASEPVKGIGAMLLGLNGMVGGGLLAVIVKLLLDLIKKVMPKKDWVKRLFPVLAPALAMIIWAVYEALTTGVSIESVLQVGLVGGIGATGLHEIVNTAIKGKVSPTVPVVK